MCRCYWWRMWSIDHGKSTLADRIMEKTGANLQFVISAIVASLTVGGKALGKELANKESTQIVHFVGIVLNKVYK